MRKKKRRRSSSVPLKAAGSGTPQCAVIGCPGQNGHGSAAAWSQTVKTKSRRGPSGAANSSQLFERSWVVSYFSSFSSSSVIGCTAPLGWLPALKPLNFPLPQRLMAHSAMMLRAEFPVHRNSTLYSRLAMARSSVEVAACYCAFAAPQQALVEDGAGAQHE